MTLFDQDTPMHKLYFCIFGIVIISFSTVAFVEQRASALNDDVIVVMNSNVVFDVLENDIVGESLPEIGIVSQPKHGMVNMNNDLSFTYTPKQDICEHIDSFMYFIAKDGNYDRATVYVDILCEPLTFISGFSPDKKSTYNSFTILGIENYPQNSLHIFDKWGKEIYYTQNYKNDWNGTTVKEQEVEDMFYYVFLDGLGNMYSGYIQLSLEVDDISSR